jgi:hypothetical protein
VTVVIGIGVNLDVVSPQLSIIGEDVVEGNDGAALVHLAVNGIGGDTFGRYYGIGHILVVVIVAASGETKGKHTRKSQQQAHKFHIIRIFHCLFNLYSLLFILYFFSEALKLQPHHHR